MYGGYYYYRGLGFFYLLILIVIYHIISYIYDKIRIAYSYIINLIEPNLVIWLLIAIFGISWWYLCRWLGSKKKAKLEAKTKNAATPFTTEPKIEPKSIPQIAMTTQIPNAEATWNESSEHSSPNQISQNQIIAVYNQKGADFYKNPEWLELARKIRVRDDYTCQICGAHGPRDKVSLHVHHIVPKGMAGKDDPSNLTTLCARCHSQQPYHHGRLRNN